MMRPRPIAGSPRCTRIADFVGEDPAGHELYTGAAHFYEQIAQDFRRVTRTRSRARGVPEHDSLPDLILKERA